LYNRFYQSWDWCSLPPDDKLSNNIRIGKISKNYYQDDIYRIILKHYFNNLVRKYDCTVYQTVKDAILTNWFPLNEDSKVIRPVIKNKFKVCIFLEKNSFIGLTTDDTLVIKGSTLNKENIFLENLYIKILNIIFFNRFLFNYKSSWKYNQESKTNIYKQIHSIVNNVLYSNDLNTDEIYYYFGVREKDSVNKAFYLQHDHIIKVSKDSVNEKLLTKIYRKKYFDISFFNFLKIIFENLENTI